MIDKTPYFINYGYAFPLFLVNGLCMTSKFGANRDHFFILFYVFIHFHIFYFIYFLNFLKQG